MLHVGTTIPRKRIDDLLDVFAGIRRGFPGARLIKAGLPVMPSVCHIVPVLVGDAVHCKLISDMLISEHGVYVQPINYPTVPKGTERLRFTPTPFHDDRMFEHLVRVMDKLWAHCNVKRMGGVAA